MGNSIGKIVELLIDWEELEFEDLGVEVMSLVEKPAIGITWQAFEDMQNDNQESEEVDPIIALASELDFGEVLDYANTIEISANQANFADLTDTLKAIIGLDILGKKDPKDEGEIKYRYSGPVAQRDFCRAMLRLNKVYTKQEVERMAGLNPGFGPRGASK